MAGLRFDKKELGNLEYSLQREMLSTDRAGGYMCTTIVCCNTRKYHGLMVCPINNDDENNYVLLSSIDETVIQHDQSFNLAIHRFPGIYEPRGHKYIVDFNYTPTPTITYRVGGVLLKKEMLWIHSKAQLLLRYTLLEAKSQTKLRLRPFLAFRNRHELSHANMFADSHSYPVPGGVRNRLYETFPYLYMQTNVDAEFLSSPGWYYNFEYAEEYKRGYPSHEDLLTTGCFETEITKNRSVIFSASLDMIDHTNLDQVFDEELARRSNKTDLLSCLRHSARQFIVRHNDRTEVVAGYPWFGRWGRDTFISLPGITLTRGDVESCKDVIDTMTRQIQNGLFPNMGTAYNSVDAPLWFFWTLHELEKYVGKEEIWRRYGPNMRDILGAYRKGIGKDIKVDDNGLVWASNPTHAMTWMDAVVNGKPVTGRDGYQVEINALWYNAICYMLDLSETFHDDKFVKEWGKMPDIIKKNFIDLFWIKRGDYLADYVDSNGANNFIRPNQIIACSLPYSMLSDSQKIDVINIVRRHLLTPRGLRTLSPSNPFYKGFYEGDQPTRDNAYHQGTVWPWLLEHYVKANFDIQGTGYISEAEDLLYGFSDEISSYGIGSIAEIYDGDPPFSPKGAISQAWSVGAILRIHQMIEEYKNK